MTEYKNGSGGDGLDWRAGPLCYRAAYGYGKCTLFMQRFRERIGTPETTMYHFEAGSVYHHYQGSDFEVMHMDEKFTAPAVYVRAKTKQGLNDFRRRMVG